MVPIGTDRYLQLLRDYLVSTGWQWYFVMSRTTIFQERIFVSSKMVYRHFCCSERCVACLITFLPFSLFHNEYVTVELPIQIEISNWIRLDIPIARFDYIRFFLLGSLKKRGYVDRSGRTTQEVVIFFFGLENTFFFG